MKYFVLFLLPCIALAQATATEFANKVFEACRANDAKSYETFLATPEVIKAFSQQIDPTIPDAMIPEAFEKYTLKAMQRFQKWQDTAKEMELDLSEVIITKTEASDREVKLKRDGKRLDPIKVTDVSIYFDCSGKKLCFIIMDAINVNGRYYLTEECVRLYPVTD
ncbi:hypothetical protein OGH69_04665 [Flavobacterium sp. MFBS3-15]|uniref:hypothetical protein n=1 Tax=Flavobacterium sp. MFBS3-15 TaxID=2989816 RepID=UPI0022360D17|nr:hypothetical protein [Flavobacterium sp. MFBS3-15]MCW4468251.1 hypothetical protein [Flavobacterium sp. MFBS3-15]